MKRKQLLTGFCASVGMLVLILDGRTALEGAQTGVALCVKTVIPSLFPFFVLSIMLTSSLTGISLPVLGPLGRLCGIPKGAESILISGFLGGYPAGAQSVAAAFHAGNLRKEEAEAMLAFCNNAGPAFLFGMVSSMFPETWMAWALWGIHIISAILVSRILPGSPHSARIAEKAAISLSNALNAAIRVMAAVCGWVVLFRVVIAFLQRWVLWLLPAEVQVAITGLLELSNGCCELLAVTDVSLRFVICSGMLAFGGLCVTMQTVSVTSGLSLRHYFTGKLLQTVFCLILSASVIYNAWLPVCLVLPAAFLLLRKNQKKSSIQAPVGV